MDRIVASRIADGLLYDGRLVDERQGVYDALYGILARERGAEGVVVEHEQRIKIAAVQFDRFFVDAFGRTWHGRIVRRQNLQHDWDKCRRAVVEGGMRGQGIVYHCVERFLVFPKAALTAADLLR